MSNDIASDTAGSADERSSSSSFAPAPTNENIDKAISETILHQPGDLDEGMDAYVFERRHQEAKDHGAPSAYSEGTRKQRLENVRDAIDRYRADGQQQPPVSSEQHHQASEQQPQYQEHDAPSHEDEAAQHADYQRQLMQMGELNGQARQLREHYPEEFEAASITHSVIPLREDIKHMVLESEHGARLLMLLGSDGGAANEHLNSLPPREAAKWINRLEVVAEYGPLQRQQQQPQHHARRQTNAPAPLRIPSGGASAPVDSQKGPEDMGAYVRWRQQQEKSKRER